MANYLESTPSTLTADAEYTVLFRGIYILKENYIWEGQSNPAE